MPYWLPATSRCTPTSASPCMPTYEYGDVAAVVRNMRKRRENAALSYFWRHRPSTTPRWPESRNALRRRKRRTDRLRRIERLADGETGPRLGLLVDRIAQSFAEASSTCRSSRAPVPLSLQRSLGRARPRPARGSFRFRVRKDLKLQTHRLCVTVRRVDARTAHRHAVALRRICADVVEPAFECLECRARFGDHLAA